jgi:MFS family permease
MLPVSNFYACADKPAPAPKCIPHYAVTAKPRLAALARSEWVTGASIVSELWPDRARGRGAGFMQCGLGIGFFLASLVWAYVGGMGPSAWRYMFLLGVLPALLTLWVRRAIPESLLWEHVNSQRRVASSSMQTWTYSQPMPR